MESLAFVGVVAALLVVLHVAVAAYLYRVALSGDAGSLFDAETDERATEADADVSADDATIEPDDQTTACPTCGAQNDPSYRFCRRCVADLTGQQKVSGGATAGRLGS